jgi:hypothetical protein
MDYHVVRFEGHFGFLKPWTAVRDSQTYSQQFLTPSVIEGMRQKLEVDAILRHRVSYAELVSQKEVVWSRDYKENRRTGVLQRGTGVLERAVMLYPVLHLAFTTAGDAEKAASQHLCLCRNEDLMYPVSAPTEMTVEEFDTINGFELVFGDQEDAFLVGHNRFEDGAPMYGALRVFGTPVGATHLGMG